MIDTFAKECQEQGFPIQSGTLVRALMTQATGQSRFKTIGNVSIDPLKEGWEKAKRGLTYAIHFARNNAGIEDPALLTSPYALLLIGISLKSVAKRSDQRRRICCACGCKLAMGVVVTVAVRVKLIWIRI